LKYIEAQNLQDFVILIENPNDEEVKRVMAKSCALLHPSRREGFGLAPVEAAYFGLPTIMIDYPDNAAIELEICSELTAQSESIEEIVSKMNLALRHQDRYRIEVLEWSKSASVNRNLFSTLQKIDAIIQSEFN
jgi:glycosyltransferase involved in cell wall biosynthesis